MSEVTMIIQLLHLPGLIFLHPSYVVSRVVLETVFGLEKCYVCNLLSCVQFGFSFSPLGFLKLGLH